jgi:hypothetical protein
MTKKLSRREFARTSAAAGAAALGLQGALVAREAAPAAGAAAAGVAAAKRRRASLPMEAGPGYGGIGADGRSVLLEHVLSPAGQAPAYPDGWQ